MPHPSIHEIVPFAYEDGEEKSRKFKCTVEEETYTLYLNRLTWSEAQEFWRVLTHVVNFIDELNSEVGEDSKEWGPVANKIFPKTLQGMDRQLFLQSESHNTRERLTKKNFIDKVKAWVETKCTSEDTSLLLQQLRNWTKPRNVPVVCNLTWMLQVNRFIELMPGDFSPLSNKEMDRAIFYAHPQAWRDDFLLYNELEESPRPKVVSFMKRREHRSNARNEANRQKQKKEGRNKKRKADYGKPNDGNNTNSSAKKSRTFDGQAALLARAKKILANNKSSDKCTLTYAHSKQGHTVGECNTLKEIKAKLNEKGSNAHSMIEDQTNTAISNDAQSDKDNGSVTSMSDNTGMFQVNTDSVQVFNSIKNFSHHIDLCPYQSNLTIGTNILDDLTSSYT